MPIMKNCQSTLLSITNKKVFPFKKSVYNSSIKTDYTYLEKALYFGTNGDLVIHIMKDGNKYVESAAYMESY